MPLFGPPNVEKLKAKGDVKGLIKAVDYKKDAAIRQAAAEVLGQIGGEQAVEPLIAALKDADKDVRQGATRALGRIGRARAVEPLMATLKDKSSNVQKAAQEALVEIGIVQIKVWSSGFTKYEDKRKEWVEMLVNIGAPAVEPLVAALQGRNWNEREAVQEALVKIGNFAVEPLVVALKNEDQGVRSGAAEVLGKIGDARAVEPLVTALKDEDQRVRSRAAEALGEIGDARAMEPLAVVLKDEHQGVRREAVEALGKIGDARAVEPLAVALTDEDREVRFYAAKALAASEDARAVEPLVAALSDESRHVRTIAVRALDAFGWQPMDDSQRVLQAVAHQNWEKLRNLGTAAIEALLPLLKNRPVDSRDRGEWVNAARTLAQIGDARTVGPLVEFIANYRDNPRLADQVISSMQQILERVPADITAEDLRAVVSLGNVVQYTYNYVDPTCGADNKTTHVRVDCSHAKQLARQELIRRGLEA